MFSIVRFLSSGTEAVPGPPAKAMIRRGGVDDLMSVEMLSQTIEVYEVNKKANGGRSLKQLSKVKLPRIALHTC
jgi:hypothetical protein